MAFNLFGGGSTPGIDAEALKKIAEQTYGRKKTVIQGLNPSLAPLSADFETKRNTLGTNLQTDVNAGVESYQRDLANLGKADADAAAVAGRNFKEQSFRDVPQIQQQIRQSLGGKGLTSNAAAVSRLADPVLAAAEASRDFDAQNKLNVLQKTSARQEKGIDQGFGSRSAALETKFGLDKDTVDYLTSIGREDLIREAENMLGNEEQLGTDQLAIEELRQTSDIAKANAKNSNRNAVLSGLTTLAGAGAGFALGGPTGAGLGAQLGGNAGQIMTGQPVQFDPTLLYAMRNRGGANKTAVVNGLRVPVGTGSY